MKHFTVTLYPVTHEVHDYGGFYTTKINLFHGKDEYPYLDFEAKNTAEVLEKVGAFANEDGGSVSASVRFKGPGRKPNGFDKKTARLYFNVETVDKRKDAA